jgi:hypothetical protein
MNLHRPQRRLSRHPLDPNLRRMNLEAAARQTDRQCENDRTASHREPPPLNCGDQNNRHPQAAQSATGFPWSCARNADGHLIIRPKEKGDEW